MSSDRLTVREPLAGIRQNLVELRFFDRLGGTNPQAIDVHLVRRDFVYVRFGLVFPSPLLGCCTNSGNSTLWEKIRLRVTAFISPARSRFILNALKLREDVGAELFESAIT